VRVLAERLEALPGAAPGDHMDEVLDCRAGFQGLDLFVVDTSGDVLRGTGLPRERGNRGLVRMS